MIVWSFLRGLGLLLYMKYYMDYHNTSKLPLRRPLLSLTNHSCTRRARLQSIIIVTHK